jgi:hypothetical protein
MSLTIDASVWIAAADATDKFHQASRDLLRVVVTHGIAVIQPTFGRTEVACALARRLRDGAQGQQLTHSLMNRMVTSEIAMDAAFLSATESIGTSLFLVAPERSCGGRVPFTTRRASMLHIYISSMEKNSPLGSQ